MKKFAFYLPQFHETKENNEFWGEGFTEWTNVRKAKPLYEGHIQPQKPLNENYYNLLDKATIQWQYNLQKKYGIDGLVFYHYYFCGRKVLEKPAENLLEWTDIEQPFFFCWANHDWRRTWEGKSTLLIEQTYGDEDDWEKHFQYLLPFFKDKRYEKKDNKPIFMIFNGQFIEKNPMLLFFNKRCQQEGFSGIYIIETYQGGYQWHKKLRDVMKQKSDITERILFREFVAGKMLAYPLPSRTIYCIKEKVRHAIDKNYTTVLRADKMYKGIWKEPIGKQYMHSVFFQWDNTPRHGKKGSIILPPQKQNFMKLMDHFKDEDYVIFNAWNEWAEGMVLEPTEADGYKYLEWIKEWDERNR